MAQRRDTAPVGQFIAMNEATAAGQLAIVIFKPASKAAERA